MSSDAKETPCSTSSPATTSESPSEPPSLPSDSSAWEKSSGIEFAEIARFTGYRFGSDGSCWTSYLCTDDTNDDGWTRLREHPTRDGYLRVSVDGTTKLAHVLICEVFHGPKPYPHPFEGPYEVLHKDGNPRNNHKDNLRWGTKIENRADQDLHGTASVGEKHWRVKIKDEDIPKILADVESGMSQRQAAAKWKTTQATISRLLAGKRKGLP